MKGNFGIWPKLALLLILGAFIINKFQVADSDLKDFKADRAAQDHPAPIAEAGDDPPAEHVQTPKKGRGKKG